MEDIRIADVARAIYRAALETNPGDPFLLQQWAIFESNHPEGSLVEAESFAREAASRDPKSNSIKHTHAVICRKRANASTSQLVKEQYRRLALERLDQMQARNDPYVLHLSSNIAIDELSDLAECLDDPPTD